MKKLSSKEHGRGGNKRDSARRGGPARARGGLRRRGGGPRIPAAFRREIQPEEPSSASQSDSDDRDLYEAEDNIAEEESSRNRRYDIGGGSDDKLIAGIKVGYVEEGDEGDEEIPSDEGEDFDDDVDEEVDDEERQLRVLTEVTKMPKQAFTGVATDGKEREAERLVLSSEIKGDEDNQRVTVDDLLEDLQGKPGYSKLRKTLQQQQHKLVALHPPLPKPEAERINRKVVYKHAKNEVTKWEPLVKRNREAPTIYFQEPVNIARNNVGAIAQEFEPRAAYEKKLAELFHDPEFMEDCKNDGERLLELNKVSVEDVKERQHRLAKMRSLLFRHEMKAKRIKKIKSKTYHRLLKKDRMKAASSEFGLDPEAAKELAMKQERERVEERLTLKHKNNSKWAKRILKRGLNVQDEGTRSAILAQLHINALLTRKMNSAKDDSSSTDSSDESSDEYDGTSEKSEARNDSDMALKLLSRAKKRTTNIIEEETELPKSGLFKLPFMERGLRKQEETAREEARRALKEYEEFMGKMADDDVDGSPQSTVQTGRRVFGPSKNVPCEAKKRQKIQNDDQNSDSDPDGHESSLHDDDAEPINDETLDQTGTLLNTNSETAPSAVFKSFDDVSLYQGPKTTYEIGILAEDSWKKVRSVNEDIEVAPAAVDDILLQDTTDQKEMDEVLDSDSDSEAEDNLADAVEKNYELPSQEELIRRAFAGDDVELEFAKDKMDLLNEEVPEPEKPVLIPGWGQWTDVQNKKGLPSWMMKEHETAVRKREQSLKNRKDAKLKHVIISETVDKRAEKLLASRLPYPHSSQEAYEQSLRVPLGPEYNPVAVASALSRPAVVKKAGLAIKPIQYEETETHEKPHEPKRIIQRTKPNRNAKKRQKVDHKKQ